MLWDELFWLILSLFLLFIGGEALVQGAASLAQRAGLTALMIGLTVVAFGTSSPELVVSVKASFAGQGDIALGNVLGSNIFNIAVILGLTALICPIAVKSQIIKFDAPIMILVSLLFPLLIIGGKVEFFEGVFLVLGIIFYTVLNYYLAKRTAVQTDENVEFEEEVPKKTPNVFVDLLLVSAGISVLIVGARILVDNSVIIARAWGVSEAVIGITIVAAGTSMPELVTCVVAAIRRHPDIAIGNVIGSNIFNILAVMGFSSLVHPIHSDEIGFVDIAVMIAVAILLLPLMWTDMKLRRIEGLILMTIYAGYLIWLWPK